MSKQTWIRPVQLELIEIFKQNKEIQVTIKEATDMLTEHGHHHEVCSVRDNLLILTSLGFLTYNEIERRFNISPNADKADLTAKASVKNCGGRYGIKKTDIELPPIRQHKIYEYKQQPPSDHCDKCGGKLGVEWHTKQFANNIQLVLCNNCFMPKQQSDFAHIAPCFCSE